MQLSEHFSLEELVYSQMALRKGLSNTPDEVQVRNLTRLAITVLEPGRILTGVPWHIDSGFRGPLVNAAVGGALNSAHLDGRAGDVLPKGKPLRQVFDILRQSDLPYDQIIIECDAWIHLAIPPLDVPPRREMLLARGYPGAWRYERVA